MPHMHKHPVAVEQGKVPPVALLKAARVLDRMVRVWGPVESRAKPIPRGQSAPCPTQTPLQTCPVPARDPLNPVQTLPLAMTASESRAPKPTSAPDLFPARVIRTIHSELLKPVAGSFLGLLRSIKTVAL